MRVVVMLGRCAALVALLVWSVACSAAGSAGLGSGALGPPLATASQVQQWVEDETGECDDAQSRSMEEFAQFVGPLRAELYAPFVSEWATCKIGPYERLGLVVFQRDRLADFQRSWKRAQQDGVVGDDPDFGFGNGFALSGTVGLEVLGLHELHCLPVTAEVEHKLPAEAEGCEYVRTTPGHHH